MFDVRKQHSCLSPDPDIELVVRLPLLSCHGTPSHVPCKELAVKLPLSAYTSAVVSSTHELHARLTASKSSLMPPEWICSVVSGTNLAIYKLAVTPPPPPVMSADFTFIITISASGRWTINVDHKEISLCWPGEDDILPSRSERKKTVTSQRAPLPRPFGELLRVPEATRGHE